MRISRKLEPSQHLELRFSVAGSLHLILSFWRIGCCKSLGAKRLKLDRIGARLDSHIDQRPRQLQIAVVIHARLSDHKNRLPRSDQLITNLNVLHLFVPVCG
jgi:hypothetical protein